MKIIDITLGYNQKTEALSVGKTAFFEELYTDCQLSTTSNGMQRLQIYLHPKQAISIQRLIIQFEYKFKPTDTIFCNGWQSWTESREFSLQETIKPLWKILHKWLAPYGDYSFAPYSNIKGNFHSWTYTYIRKNTNNLLLLGSISEESGFTLFQTSANENKITVSKDIDDLNISHSFPILDIVWQDATDSAAFDNYFSFIERNNIAAPATGWTSWYLHYTKINKNIIEHNLNSCDAFIDDASFFQIDDGWQTKVGDWLSVKPNMGDMADIAQNIHHKNKKAGLWLAPFIVEKTSNIYQQHPDWLLKQKNGMPVIAGINPLWSGMFYVLDFYNEKVQEYINAVLHTILYVWKYDLVKLDFLYAACLQPPNYTTRGGMMCDVMNFLRQRIPQPKKMLACGVPLGAAFGKTDYCRIGADIHLRWEHKLLAMINNRERVSTKIALNSTIGRWHLDGRAFRNDPDVFILRTEKQHLTPHQRNTVFVLNNLLGSLIFTSDDIANYSSEITTQFLEIFNIKERKIICVNQTANGVEISFLLNNQTYNCYANLSNETIQTKYGLLEPYETTIQ